MRKHVIFYDPTIYKHTFFSVKNETSKYLDDNNERIISSPLKQL